MILKENVVTVPIFFPCFLFNGKTIPAKVQTPRKFTCIFSGIYAILEAPGRDQKTPTALISPGSVTEVGVGGVHACGALEALFDLTPRL